MTASIPLSAMSVPDGIRRDRWGRYLVVPPGGGEPVAYTRATTVAKALDDGGGLAAWKASLAVVGTIMRRGLRTQWEALMAATDGDPWYANQWSKGECKRLVTECAAAGGAEDRREIGTALHAITALVDQRRYPHHVTEETEADIRAYRQALDDEGVSIIPGQIELTVVLDDWRVAGTFDRLTSVLPSFSRPLVTDLKCGADLTYSWQSIAVQMACYSRANAVYRQGVVPDGSEDERLAMPEVDQDNGLVIWLNAGTGRCELFLVDLAAGWEAFELSMAARAWRKNRSVSRPLADGKFVHAPADDDVLIDLLQASVEKIDVDPPDDGSPGRSDGTDSPGAAVTPADFTEALRAWLQERIDAIGGHSEAARADLGMSWPTETLAGVTIAIPTLLTSTDHAPEQLAAIEAVLGAVERRHAVVFPQPRPEPETDEALVLHIFPGATITNNNTEESPR